MVDTTTTIYKSKIFYMQCIGGFLFLFVYDVRINLRGFDVCMSPSKT